MSLLVARARRLGATTVACLVALAPVGNMMSFTLIARAHLFSRIGFAAGLFALDIAWVRKPGWRPAVAAVAFGAVWTWAHPGAITFELILGLEVLGAAVMAFRKGSWGARWAGPRCFSRFSLWARC